MNSELPQGTDDVRRRRGLKRRRRIAALLLAMTDRDIPALTTRLLSPDHDCDLPFMDEVLLDSCIRTASRALALVALHPLVATAQRILMARADPASQMSVLLVDMLLKYRDFNLLSRAAVLDAESIPPRRESAPTESSDELKD
jgi:hypothetical protein